MFNFFGGGKKPIEVDGNKNRGGNADEKASSLDEISKVSSGNPLLDNLDRTVFTFNMHNLTEMCF